MLFMSLIPLGWGGGASDHMPSVLCLSLINHSSHITIQDTPASWKNHGQDSVRQEREQFIFEHATVNIHGRLVACSRLGVGKRQGRVQAAETQKKDTSTGAAGSQIEGARVVDNMYMSKRN